MYTSFCAGSTGGVSQRSTRRQGRVQQPPPTADELREAGQFERHSVLHLGQRLMNNKIVVKRIITGNTFIVYHEDFRQEFMLKRIDDTEDITEWIDMQNHSNVVTAFDQFVDPESGLKFYMAEYTNKGNMYQYIESLSLRLAEDVPLSYIELVYDVAIQLATGLDFAHSNGLVHGQFDLSEVQLHGTGRSQDNLVYKINDFQPKGSLQLPLNEKANYWPFAKNKKTVSDNERKEVLMLKDIYSLGICILELMIGRFGKKTFSISLESLPLTWAEFPESTPLIQVLVECIQIDSITSRKGKLVKIRKLLISEYKKFFKKAFYKMENPFVGKRADVLNKKAIVALFHQRGVEDNAINLWQQAMEVQDTHFDSKCNQVMFRWSTAKIPDTTMFAELEERVFDVPHKGQTLKAYLEIATGERERGLQTLHAYIDGFKKEKASKGKVVDIKSEKNLKTAEQVEQMVALDKETFPQNTKLKHNHESQVLHFSFSENGAHFVTTAQDDTRVWRLQNNLAVELCCIPKTESDSIEQPSMSAVNDAGSVAIVHRGNLMFTIYDITGQEFAKRTCVELEREVKANGNPGFELVIGDKVTDVRFVDADLVRVAFTKSKEHYFIEFKMSDQVATMRKCKRYEDYSVFGMEPSDTVTDLSGQQKVLQDLLDDELSHGNKVAFPSVDCNTVIVLKKEDPTQKSLLVFDIRRNGYVRRINKSDMESEAFALNSTGRMLGYVDGADLIIKLVRLPNSPLLVDCLRPRYQVAEKKLNPVDAAESKQYYKDKLYKDLHTYHLYQADPVKAKKISGISREDNAYLMVLKYENASQRDKYKLKANREFLMMAKILLKEAAKESKTTGENLLEECPLARIYGQKRVEIYDDELSYLNQKSQIDHVQISSETNRHFFLLAMDRIVYKYDLVTKQLLFQFKTVAEKALLLYDRDDKLLCASDKMIRLWDFYDHKEEAPELITACEPKLKIERVFLNKATMNHHDATPTLAKGENPAAAKLQAEKKHQEKLLVLVTNKNQWELYKGRMDFLKSGDTGMYEDANILSACFDMDSTRFWLGLDNGRLACISTSKDRDEVTKLFDLSPEMHQPVTMLSRFDGIPGDENTLLAVLGNQNVVVYNDRREDYKPVLYEEPWAGKLQDKQAPVPIVNVAVAYNSKFFMIGHGGKERAMGFFKYNHAEFSVSQSDWFNKYKFSDFYTDEHLSCVMLLDEERRTLDHQLLLWDYDMKKLDEKRSNLRKLDNITMPNNKPDLESDSDEDPNGEKALASKVSDTATCCTIF